MPNETTQCDGCGESVEPRTNPLIGTTCPECGATIESTFLPGPRKSNGDGGTWV